MTYPSLRTKGLDVEEDDSADSTTGAVRPPSGPVSVAPTKGAATQVSHLRGAPTADHRSRRGHGAQTDGWIPSTPRRAQLQFKKENIRNSMS